MGNPLPVAGQDRVLRIGEGQLLASHRQAGEPVRVEQGDVRPIGAAFIRARERFGGRPG